jgi:hypothetical protein
MAGAGSRKFAAHRLANLTRQQLQKLYHTAAGTISGAAQLMLTTMRSCWHRIRAANSKSAMKGNQQHAASLFIPSRAGDTQKIS